MGGIAGDLERGGWDGWKGVAGTAGRGGGTGVAQGVGGMGEGADGIGLERLALGDVASTGLLTAFCHAAESRSERPILKDARMEGLVDRLAAALAGSPSGVHRRLVGGRLRRDLVVHLALRARRYDGYARGFAARHPGCCVVNLGCGLDTRFWRVDDGRMRFYDLDLPEMIGLKRKLLAESDRYRMLGMSVLDHGWMDVVAGEAGPWLFLAEGLMMYLPPEGVRGLVVALCERFGGSELVFETVSSRWLKPWLRWMIDFKMQRQLGLGPGAVFTFGIRDAHEPEEWHPGLRLLEEWDWLDEDEPKLGALRWFRGWGVFARTQWTVRYGVGGDEGMNAVHRASPLSRMT